MSGPSSVFQKHTTPQLLGAEFCLEFDAQHVLQHFNIDSQSNLLGVAPSGAIGTSPEQSAVSPKLADLANAGMKSVRKTGRPTVYRIQLPHLSTERELQVRILPMQTKAGGEMAFLVLNKVVALTEPTREERMDWEGIYGQSPDVVFVLDQKQRVVYANDHQGTSFPTLSPGQTLHEVLDQEAQTLFSVSVQRCLSDFHALQFEYTRQEGSVPRWFSANVNPVRMGAERFAVVALRETSWMKSQLMALRQENDVYQSVLAGNRGAVLVLNRSSAVVFSNNEAQGIPGLLPYGPEQAISRGVVTLLHPRNRQPISADQLPFELARQGKICDPLEVLWVHAASDTALPVNITAQPNLNGEGEPDGVMLFLQVVSDRQLEEQAKLWTYQAMSQLVHTVSHDFRVPINNMVNLCALARHPSQQARQDELLERIDHSARMLKDQLDGLMQLVRNGSGQQLPVGQCRFKDEWEAVQQDLQELQQEKQAAIRAYFAPCPEVRFNSTQLRSILFNLVSNALKYSDPSRPSRVEITSNRHQGFAVLTVRDNGLGMDLEKHEGDLWAPFRRIHSHGPGKGLGLSLIRTMVEQVGGRIEVESAVGKGTSFYVYLPESRALNAQYSLF